MTPDLTARLKEILEHYRVGDTFDDDAVKAISELVIGTVPEEMVTKHSNHAPDYHETYGFNNCRTEILAQWSPK